MARRNQEDGAELATLQAKSCCVVEMQTRVEGAGRGLGRGGGGGGAV